MGIYTKNISDIDINDRVIGSSGEPIKINKIIEEHIPNRMFRLTFVEGIIDCSDNHLWKVWDETGISVVVDTIDIFSSPEKFKLRFGAIDGGILRKIKEIKPKPVSCISIDSEDNLFEISLPNGVILTHNCQFRAGCGRLGSIASMMLFGNTIATTVDGNHPGAGMISSNGSVSSIQYYFEEISWIDNFYSTCGFDKKGFRTKEEVKDTDKDHEITEITEENLEDILNFESEVEEIEIEGLKAEFDKTKRQDFEI